MLSEFRSTHITWDKATSRIYSPVTANASDENGRKLVVQIVNGGQVEALTGTTLHLYWITRDKLHDGLDVFKAVDLNKGEFELSYTTGMLSNKGVLNANLVLVDAVGRVVSERFKITVTDGINNDAIQSENSFSSLTQALIDISNLEQNYAPRLNDLTAQLQQKAEQEALETEKARIDNLIDLPDGSTTNDARLEDITVAVDGTIYNSPGNAVRGQIGKINKDLAEVATDVKPLNLWNPQNTDGYYTANGAFTSDPDRYGYQSFDVAEGDVISGLYWSSDILGYTKQNCLRFICAKSNGVVVSASGTNTASQRYVVPAGIDEVVISVAAWQYTNNVLIAVNDETVPTEIQEWFEPYKEVKTDKSLTSDSLPANAKAVGDRINGLSIESEKHATKYVHLSLDDSTFWADLTNNSASYTSCFENPLLGALKGLHDTYGCVFTLNCFIVSGEQSISTVTSKFASEFSANKHWLRFAFHGTTADETYGTDMVETITGYYNTFVNAIIQMTGDIECIDRVTRLSSHTGSLNNVLALRDCNCGITGLLATDSTTNGVSYYMDADQGAYILSHCKLFDADTQLWFIKSLPRIESTSLDPNALGSLTHKNFHPIIELFWHETKNWINDYWYDNILLPWLNYIDANDYKYAFPRFIAYKLIAVDYEYIKKVLGVFYQSNHTVR